MNTNYEMKQQQYGNYQSYMIANGKPVAGFGEWERQTSNARV